MPHGHGVLVWLDVDNFDAAIARGRGLGGEIFVEPCESSRPASGAQESIAASTMLRAYPILREVEPIADRLNVESLGVGVRQSLP